MISRTTDAAILGLLTLLCISAAFWISTRAWRAERRSANRFLRRQKSRVADRQRHGSSEI